jgi:hypothetical protein
VAVIIAIVISKPLEIKIFEKKLTPFLLKEKCYGLLLYKKEVARFQI